MDGAGEEREVSGAAEGPGTPDAAAVHERACMACRGSGSVLSNLGGSASTVTCPWCAGSGRRGVIADAQASRKTAGESPP